MTPHPNQRFSAPYDRTVMWATGLVAAVLLVVALVTGLPALLAVDAIIIAGGYAFSPRGYRIENGEIAVERLVGDLRIPLNVLRAARAATPDDTRGMIRLFGSGGFFGYYGLFRTAQLGTCHFYATDRSKMVVLIGEDRNYVLSPHDVTGFLDTLRLSASVASEAVGEVPRKGLNVAYAALAIVGVAGLAAALGGVYFAVTYAPGPPAYTLTADSLIIHDRMYGVTILANTVDLAGVEVVPITRESPWCPTLRVNGFSNSHYHSGWFKVASGQKVRMYWSNSSRLVLLPSKTGREPVLLEASDPEGLVRELHGQWASRH